MLIIPIAVIGIVLYLFYRDKGLTNGFSLKKSPEDILKERFVNGEIDEKTYLEMKDVLKG